MRAKPDVTAADGVRTSLPDFDPFFGTSAAAPHAAAIAALVLSGNPGLSATAVRDALTSTALDIERPGRDRDTGNGIVLATRVLARTGATPQQVARARSIGLASTTDGDAFLEPGETGRVRVSVVSTGDTAARRVQVRLTTTTPGITITPSVRGYGSIPRGGTETAAPFTVSVASSIPLGSRVTLRATVTFDGTQSPTTSTSRLVIGQPSAVADFGYSGPAVAIPDDDPAGASVRFHVAGVGPLSSVTFSVDGRTCSADEGATTVGISHTFVQDLTGILTAPDGTAVTLFDGAGSSGNNICQAVFDDREAVAFDSLGSDAAPFTGQWKPTQPLSQLIGRQGDGSWTFTTVDGARLDTGSLRSVSLHLAGFVPPR